MALVKIYPHEQCSCSELKSYKYQPLRGIFFWWCPVCDRLFPVADEED